MKIIKKRKNSDKNIAHLFPIVFIIVIVPLITYGKVIKVPLVAANFWKGGTTHLDFSSYYKAIYLVGATFLALLSFCFLRLNNQITLQKEKKYYILMAGYTFFALLSVILSHSKHVALFGFIELHQGIFVLLSYIALTFLLINYTNDEKSLMIFINSFVVLIIVEGLIGVGEYMGLDFFQSSFGRWLITPKKLQGIPLKFTSGKYSIYGTMYNSNFVGSFGAMMLPLSTALYLFACDKKNFLFGITSLLAFSIWLGCNSRAGYLGIILASAIGVVVFRKVIIEKYKKLLLLITGFIFIAITFNTASEGRIFNQFSRLNPIVEAQKIGDIQINKDIKFEEVSVKDNTFTIKTNKETLIGVAENYKVTFADELGNKLEIDIDSDVNVTFVNERYDDYKFFIPIENPAQINTILYGRNLNLYITEDQNIKVISYNNKLTEPIEAPRFTFLDGKETFASNRGYIWSRTIPILKDTFFVGYGPDNFIMVFPHEDYVGRFNVGSSGMNIIVDKPHNLYLQTAVNTGVLSLISLLFFWGIYLVNSMKIYLKGNLNSYTEYMGAAIFLSITAYLVAGMFNDSIVAVAPLFWILLGMGIGINRMVKDKGHSA